MQPIFALLPQDETIAQIFSIRKDIIAKKWGSEDTRKNTLPHISLVYANSELNQDKLMSLTQEADSSFTTPAKITLQITRFQTWDNKISAKFNSQKLTDLTQKSSDIFDKFKILDTTTKPSKIADHMKIARNIKPEYLQAATEYIQSVLPPSATFDKLVLIDTNCTPKDILWEKTKPVYPSPSNIQPQS